jgi:hypothetical protein
MRFGKIGSILVLGVVVITGRAFSQQPMPKPSKVDLGSFVKEIMILNMEGNQRQLAMWFPFEFFVQSVMAEGGKSRADAEKEIGFLKPFQVIVVQSGWERDDGTTAYAGEKEVRARARLRPDQGSELEPLERVPPLVSASVEEMKKLLASDGGAGNASMQVMIFPAEANKSPVIDTSKKGKLTFVLKPDGRFQHAQFVWRTPFDATTTVPPCSRCKESVSPKWTFCAWCGLDLEKR